MQIDHALQVLISCTFELILLTELAIVLVGKARRLKAEWEKLRK